MKTNLGRKFLNIIDRCFPNGHLLHKIFNKHVLKLTNSCMNNMKSIILSQNKALLLDYHRSQIQTNEKECNRRKKDQCPTDRKCLTQNVVYQVTVSTQSSSQTYIGLATNFKERYRNHATSFRHQSKRNETELSKHIWTLKYKNKPINIMGRIIKQCRPYSNVSNKCNLCLFEKFVILCKKNFYSLNKRNQLVTLFPPQKQIPTQELCYKVMQSFVTCTLGLPLCTTFLYSLTVNNAPLELSFFRLHHFQKSVKILGNMDLA